ncbi:hypothetical protein G7Y89_g1984 [Cudoniella acicularis]|uniref:Uncharacterized protein n=1 Tax=Cudoniella acicularis TaxID=354080 RepID=A0A8H4W6H2_9HELO|nr:hypothetical protein G7Y89_g1984 [Cudoniella acicularis]
MWVLEAAYDSGELDRNYSSAQLPAVSFQSPSPGCTSRGQSFDLDSLAPFFQRTLEAKSCDALQMSVCTAAESCKRKGNLRPPGHENGPPRPNRPQITRQQEERKSALGRSEERWQNPENEV